MSRKFDECIKLMRQLVSDVQGAPYPGDSFESELYKIWYEHAQRTAVECFEYLDENFPDDKADFNKVIKKLLDN